MDQKETNFAVRICYIKSNPNFNMSVIWIKVSGYVSTILLGTT